MKIMMQTFDPSKYRGTFVSSLGEDSITSMGERIFSFLQADASQTARRILAEIATGDKINFSKEINTNAKGKFTLSDQEYLWLMRNDSSMWLRYLEYRSNFRKVQVIGGRPDFPRYVLIEPTSVCNLRCPFCFQVDKTFTKKQFMGIMELDLFKKVVDECHREGVEAITLASRGEPLLHPSIGEMLAYLSVTKFLDVKINTNATRLTPEIARSILDAGVSEVVFSVDSGDSRQYEELRKNANFKEVFNNIKTFDEIRRTEYPKSRTISRISGVLLSDQQSSDLMVSMWADYVDSITVKPASPRWDSYKNPVIETNSVCSLLSERLYVWWDGTVNPCDFDYKSYLSPGTAKSNPLRELWNGDVYQRIIRNHILRNRGSEVPCDRCPY